MVCRFGPDGSGAVIAEARSPDINSFLGLNFPAPTSRGRRGRSCWRTGSATFRMRGTRPRLSCRHQIHWPAAHSISAAVSFAVSPQASQYLPIWVWSASISLSLILRGQLWGLIVCHHRAPRYLPHRLRDACELFAEMTSSHLEMKLIEVDLEHNCKCAHPSGTGRADESGTRFGRWTGPKPSKLVGSDPGRRRRALD